MKELLKLLKKSESELREDEDIRSCFEMKLVSSEEIGIKAKSGTQLQEIKSRLNRLRGISFESISKSDLLSEYKLQTVIVIDSDTNTFIMKKYMSVLWKVSLFGTDNAIFLRQVYAKDRYGSGYSFEPRIFPMEEKEIKEFSVKVALKYHLLLTQKIQDNTRLNKNVADVISDYVVGSIRKNQ